MKMGRIDRLNESYDALMHILSEPHRDRALLVASVNRRLNAAVLKFMEPFRKLFEVLQFNSKPTINFAVLVYYKAAELTELCPNNDDPAIATLKKEFRQLLDKAFFADSLKAHHWLATFLDPHYKRFEFLPTGTREEIVFKKRLLTDVEKWIMQHMEKAAASNASETQEPDVRMEKRARREIPEDPFSDFRDGATSNVLSTNHSSGRCDQQLLRQVILLFHLEIHYFLFYFSNIIL